MWMWPFEDELEIWFEEVDQQRKERYGDTGGQDNNSNESGGWVPNELAKGRGR